MVISEDTRHTPIANLLAVELFLRLRSVAAGIRTQTFCLRGQLSNELRHRMGIKWSVTNVRCLGGLPRTISRVTVVVARCRTSIVQ